MDLCNFLHFPPSLIMRTTLAVFLMLSPYRCSWTTYSHKIPQTINSLDCSGPDGTRTRNLAPWQGGMLTNCTTGPKYMTKNNKSKYYLITDASTNFAKHHEGCYRARTCTIFILSVLEVTLILTVVICNPTGIRTRDSRMKIWRDNHFSMGLWCSKKVG